jgi:hypothetical protein
VLQGAENIGDASNAPGSAGDSCFATSSMPPISFLRSAGHQSSKNAEMKPQTADGVDAAELGGVSHTTEQVALPVLERGKDVLERTWAIADDLPGVCDA